jgi:hypothetical protein
MTIDNLYIVLASVGLLGLSWLLALVWTDRALPASDKFAPTLVAVAAAVAGVYGLGRGLMLW